AIYGSNAAGGVINVITKKGMEKSGGSILLEGGNHGWFRGSLRGTAVLSDDLKVSVGYTKTQENSEINIRKRPNGTYDKATDYRGNDFVFGVEKGKWSFLSQVGDYESEWNSSDFGPTDYSQKNNYRRFQLNYIDEVNTGRIYYNENSKDYFIVNTETFNKYKDSTIGATYSHKQEIFGIAGVWGIDWRRESSEFEGGAGNIPYDLSRNGFAPYVEMSVPVGEAQLDIGLRYEHWQVDAGENVNEFIPRVSLNWESPSGKLWYATAGRFFAMPSFYQIFLPMADEDGIWGKYVSLRNPDLKPEKGWTYDIGVKDQKAKNPWSLGAFYINMEDKIYYSSEYDLMTNTTSSQYINLSEYRAWGIEAEIKFNFHENWSYTQGISWTDADEKKEGKDEWTRSGMPRLDLNGRLNYVKGPWATELNAHYYGDRNIGGVNFNDDNDNIFLMNASVSWKEGSHKLVLSCTNIFDKEFVLDSEGYINPERKFILSWQYEF
ncbi:MAG: TonB-dependent receptor, partial [Clostridiales bacterium]|nr:TonB-dependent receptor [Clostridiales bacterium]